MLRSQGGLAARAFVSVQMARIAGIPAEPTCTAPEPCTWQYYVPPDGLTGPSANRDDVEMLSPTEPVVLRDLDVRLMNPPGTANESQVHVAVQVNGGANTPGGAAISCEVTNGLTCSTPSTVVVPARGAIRTSRLGAA